ncbi:MAG: sugar transferase [Moraxella sp.]|nr:sugar transferase [Moraxella sp.]
MNLRLWHSLAFRLLTGWLIISILPAILMWSDEILSWQFLQTQINSFIASSVGILLSIWTLTKFTRFPGQRSMLMVLPTLLGVAVLLASVFLVFRVPYSVYYLTASLGVGLVFCFISQMVLRATSVPSIGYVPIGRCLALTEIENVHWVALSPNHPLSCRELSCQAVVADLADSALSVQWERLLAQATLDGIPVYNVLQVQESLTGRLPIKHLYENNLGSLLPSQAYLLFKRLLDTLVILFSLPITLPIAALTATVIQWESRHTGGSILFVQERIGQGGKPFKMYKFRSMITTSEADGAKMATIDDVRITPFGRFIRKMRIDELPQFVNVIKGEMSLIGPRPEQRSFVVQFEQDIPFYSYRHIVKPGISGWAQVMHGYAGDEDETRVKLEHDFFYIKNFSLTLDLLIAIKTVQVMMTGFGAR